MTTPPPILTNSAPSQTRLQRGWHWLSQWIATSPVRSVLLIGMLLLAVLLARGLNIGPLQTDVIINRAWFHEVGVRGFSQRMSQDNQRHILAGSEIAAAYALFGENDLPYNLIFQSSRILEGVFLAGIIYQLTHQRALAIGSGMGLAVTVIRVRELYQGINFWIEPTLPLLLASSYTYLLALRSAGKSRRYRLICYLISVSLYIISVLIYESGLPWVGVNLALGWIVRSDQTFWRRTFNSVRDAIPEIVCAATVTILVLFVFTPWKGLAPDAQAASPLRILAQMGTALTFPGLYLSHIQIIAADGYLPLLLLFAVIAAGIAPFVSLRPAHVAESQPAPHPYLTLIVLALIMLFSSVLVGTSNQIGQEYLDRINFGRAVGISLLYVTVIFAIGNALGRWIRPSWRNTIPILITALLLIGPGFAWLWTYQDYAQVSRAEIGRLTTAVREIRRQIYLPAHLVILTDPDWPLAKFTDASDVILHEVQQALFQANEPATIDFLKQGGYYENYATRPGTCETVNGQRSAGMCMGDTMLTTSRWAEGQTHPNADVVIVHWDWHAGKMTIMPSLALGDLAGYNITTAGPTTLQTNMQRVAAP